LTNGIRNAASPEKYFSIKFIEKYSNKANFLKYLSSKFVNINKVHRFAWVLQVIFIIGDQLVEWRKSILQKNE